MNGLLSQTNMTGAFDAAMPALWLSLRVSVIAVLVMLVPGVVCGWLLARARFPGRSVVDAIIHLPLVLPPVVVGYMLLLALGRRGWLGGVVDRLGIDIAFTWKAAVIASAIMGFPLLVRAVRLSIESADERCEQAAATLGAPPLRVWWTVTLPLAMPGIVTGAILAFARSLGEFGATITFAGNIAGETRTLPLAVFTFTQTPDGGDAATVLVIVSILVSLGALMISEQLAQRARRMVRVS